jgi:transposase-like protein
MKLKKYIRYSEAFKQQVVEQIEAGKFRNIAGVNQAYGIRGSSTVIRWIKQYGSDKSLPQHIKIMSLNEIDETRELKKRVRELERALAETQMRNLLSESFLDIACERMNTDAAQFKKKHATQLSGLPGKKDRP